MNGQSERVDGMKVVILAGGYGTRLSEETGIIPKPMIEIGGRPLLWHLMKTFRHHGMREFIVALGYKGQVIKRYFLQYPQLESNLRIDLASGRIERDHAVQEDWTVDLVDTGSDSMTGGRLRRLGPMLDSTFIFTYGDGLADIDINRLIAFHRRHGKLATVTAVEPPSRFGILQMDGDRVDAFEEKPAGAGGRISGGFFVLEPQVIDYIEGDETRWEAEPLERLAREGQLHAYSHQGFWQCVDTLHELRVLRNMWELGRAPWKLWN
jgi:glucose-1-phosphate cytidylyltransferase